MKNLEVKEHFIELRAKGMSFDKISKKLNVSKVTLIDWSKKFELEISNMKAIEVEALQEKYYMQKQKRIELFGSRLEAIINELDKRDLSEVPTEKLFDILIKYSAILEKEKVDTVFMKQDEFDLDDLKTYKKWKA